MRLLLIFPIAALLLLVAAPAQAVTLDDPDADVAILQPETDPLVVEEVPDGWLGDDGVWRAPLTEEELAQIPENVEPDEPAGEPTPAIEEPEPCVTEADGWSTCDDGATWAADAPDDASGSIG